MVQAPNESSSPDEELFQQVPDGWLFTTPILWPVGGRKYVVNDTQKVDLVERLTRWRRRSDRMFSVVLLVIILWQLTRYDWIAALSELVGVNSEILGVAIFLLIMLLFAFVTPAVQLLAIRPILAGAMATPVKVGLLDSVLALLGLHRALPCEYRHCAKLDPIPPHPDGFPIALKVLREPLRP